MYPFKLYISIWLMFDPFNFSDQEASCDLVETSRSRIVTLLLVELMTSTHPERDILTRRMYSFTTTTVIDYYTTYYTTFQFRFELCLVLSNLIYDIIFVSKPQEEMKTKKKKITKKFLKKSKQNNDLDVSVFGTRKFDCAVMISQYSTKCLSAVSVQVCASLDLFQDLYSSVRIYKNEQELTIACHLSVLSILS